MYQFSLYLTVRKIERRSKNRFKKRREEFVEKRMSNRRRTITNQLVRRRNPTPHEFPPGWTIKSERVCPTYLETNGETWINNVFDSPTLLSPRVHRFPSPFLFFFLFQEDTIPRYERRGIDVVTHCLGSNSICMVGSPVFRRRRDYSKNRRIESERLWTDPWKIKNSDRNIS